MDLVWPACAPATTHDALLHAAGSTKGPLITIMTDVAKYGSVCVTMRSGSVNKMGINKRTYVFGSYVPTLPPIPPVPSWLWRRPTRGLDDTREEGNGCAGASRVLSGRGRRGHWLDRQQHRVRARLRHKECDTQVTIGAKPRHAKLTFDKDENNFTLENLKGSVTDVNGVKYDEAVKLVSRPHRAAPPNPRPPS